MQLLSVDSGNFSLHPFASLDMRVITAPAFASPWVLHYFLLVSFLHMVPGLHCHTSSVHVPLFLGMTDAFLM